MRMVISAVAGLAVVCCALAATGCGGPETGTQVKVSDAEVQQRTQGIKDAMKAGMYNNPMKKSTQAKK